MEPTFTERHYEGFLTALILFLSTTISTAYAHAPSGALFTTGDDGTRVNANLYRSKEAVYLNGGPAGTAAGLDDGDYVFQVTSPDGQVLLSQDAAKCRVVRIAAGRIVARLDWDGGGISPYDFSPHGGNDACHRTAKHEQHADSEGPPAVTVQLYPFADTTSPGGGYKVWLTSVGDFVAGCGTEYGLNESGCGYSPGNFHGFLVPHSKTDNFHVKEKNDSPGKPRAVLTVYQYCDTQCNGSEDIGEPCLNDVPVEVSDATGSLVCSGVGASGVFECVLPGTGAYTVSELLGSEYAVCGAAIDGLPTGTSSSVVVDVRDRRAEVLVTFGNTPVNGQILASTSCAVNGQPIEGFQVSLSGDDVLGGAIVEAATTSVDGTATFAGLAAGSYSVAPGSVTGLLPVAETNCQPDLAVDTSLDPVTGQPGCSTSSGACEFSYATVGDVGARTPAFWCTQVLREAGENPGTDAACYVRLLENFGSIQNITESAFFAYLGAGGDGALFDLDGNGSVSPNESRQILCPQGGDAYQYQCRRQAFAMLMNLVGYLNPNMGTPVAGCDYVGVLADQPIIVNGELRWVQDVFDQLIADNCSDVTWALLQGINESGITVLPSCPAVVIAP